MKWNYLIRHPEIVLEYIVGKTIDPERSIVITGFWRSGTTWLLQSISQSLKAKSVFEPFHYSVPEYVKCLPNEVRRRKDDIKFINAYMPGENKNKSINTRMKKYVKQSITSSLICKWIRYCREHNRRIEGNVSEYKAVRLMRRVKNSTRKRVVCKFVRGHLLHSNIKKWFRLNTIHIRRDPRSVVKSIKNTFDLSIWRKLDPKDQLIGIQDKRQDYFNKWKDEISKVSKLGWIAKTTLYWALTEKYIQSQRYSPDIYLSYEKLVEERDQYISGKIDKILPEKKINLIDSSSSTTKESRNNHNTDGWKEVLKSEEIKTVNETIMGLGLEELINN